MPKDLLVPGTSGNKLVLDGEDLGWPSALTAQGWLAGMTGFALGLDGMPISAGDIVQLLSMEYADTTSAKPTRSTLKPGGSVGRGDLLKLAYNQFLDFDVFAYDFRSDIRESGRLLLEYLLAERPGGDRWRIVCHSQGGLVVVAASKLYAQSNDDDDRAFSELVSHVGFVGVPFYGTINAAEALLHGEQLGGGFAQSFLSIARTWPSLHQMLPAWPGCVRAVGPDGVAKPALIAATSPLAWPGQAISAAMLLRARETRKILGNPIARMNKVKKRILMSQAHPTRNHLLLSGGQVSIPPANEKGDTLVPSDTTYKAQAQFEREVTHVIGDDGNTMKHFVLCNDPVVATEMKTFFGQ